VGIKINAIVHCLFTGHYFEPWLPPLWWTEEIGSVQQTQAADWQVDEVTIVVECSNIFPIPELDF